MTWARGWGPRAPSPSAHTPRGRDSAPLALANSLSERTFQGSGSAASAPRQRAGPAPGRLCASRPRPRAQRVLEVVRRGLWGEWLASPGCLRASPRPRGRSGGRSPHDLGQAQPGWGRTRPARTADPPRPATVGSRWSARAELSTRVSHLHREEELVCVMVNHFWLVVSLTD